jgi:hypothetical protein
MYVQKVLNYRKEEKVKQMKETTSYQTFLFQCRFTFYNANTAKNQGRQ